MFVRLKAIMEDTLMTAQVVINSNDVLTPKVVIPVNFRMLPQTTTVIFEGTQEKSLIIKSIYPNPAKDYIMIESFEKITEIQLFNAAGVLQRKLQISTQSSQININVSDLPSGYYHLQVKSDSGIEHQKLLIH
jgi:hypothetical protein